MNDQTRSGWGLRVWATLVAIVLVAPLLVVVPLSFAERRSFIFPPRGLSLTWYQNLFTDERWTSAIVTSLYVGLLVTAIATVLGSAAAIGIHRYGGRLSAVLTGILIAPMVVPGIVSAVAIYSVYLRWQLTGNLQGFLLAHTVLAVPFVVITVASSLRSTDPLQEKAAASLGAGPWRTFVRVTLPSILPGVAAGSLFAFVTSFDEVVAASFLQSPAIRTLPIEMFVSVTNEVDPTIAAVSTVILALTTAIVVLPVVVRTRKSNGESAS
jgi:putative spermidine/putrescine transport system permease protein